MPHVLPAVPTLRDCLKAIRRFHGPDPEDLYRVAADLLQTLDRLAGAASRLPATTAELDGALLAATELIEEYR